MPRKLPDYLRSERRRAGLSQEDIAALLGTGVLSISRYEQRRRLPPLELALAYQAVFGTPVAELFPGRFREIVNLVRDRAERRKANLGRVTNPRHVSRRKEKLNAITTQ
jgi:transcriptional regulator with XRE-family HTH domain